MIKVKEDVLIAYLKEFGEISVKELMNQTGMSCFEATEFWNPTIYKKLCYMTAIVLKQDQRYIVFTGEKDNRI